MNYYQAQDLLDQVRHGHNAPSFLIDKALELTGDLCDRTLCEDGFESGIYRPCETESQGTRTGRDWDVGGFGQSSSPKAQGIEG